VTSRLLNLIMASHAVRGHIWEGPAQLLSMNPGTWIGCKWSAMTEDAKGLVVRVDYVRLVSILTHTRHTGGEPILKAGRGMQSTKGSGPHGKWSFYAISGCLVTCWWHCADMLRSLKLSGSRTARRIPKIWKTACCPQARWAKAWSQRMRAGRSWMLVLEDARSLCDLYGSLEWAVREVQRNHLPVKRSLWT